MRSALDMIQPRVVSYEEQVTALREQLAGVLESEEDWARAAQTLAGIDLDSGTFNVMLEWLYCQYIIFCEFNHWTTGSDTELIE